MQCQGQPGYGHNGFQSQNGLILVHHPKPPLVLPGVFQSQNGLILVKPNLNGIPAVLIFQSQNGLILVRPPIYV